MENKKDKVATIFGGTGFIGTQIVRDMARAGWTVKVATRIPERAYFLRPCGFVGQIVPWACDYGDKESIEKAVEGSDYVVNCIGILYEKKKGAFDKVHHDIPKEIAQACKKFNVPRFVHVSSLGVKSTSRYGQSKLKGDEAIKKIFPNVSIIRPSVVFGPEDSFFNMFAELARYLPALPLIGGGHTKLQPVYVGDVADAVMKALTRPPVDKKDPRGKIYELGGPDIVTFKDIYKIMLETTGRKRALIPLPWPVAKMQASVMGLMPKPLLTVDQVESLKCDNVVDEQALGLEDLDVMPTAMDLVLPEYLVQYCPGGRIPEKKRAN